MKDQVLQEFNQTIRKEIPKFGIGFKDESFQMKTLGFLLAPFNPEFMTSYTTTWGSKVYFATRSRLVDVRSSFAILAHEFVHLMDDKQHGFLGFKGTYALPQILALLPLIAFGVVGGWPSLLSLLGSYLLAATVFKVLPEPKASLFGLIFALPALGSLYWGWVLVQWWSLLLLATAGMLVLPSPWRTRWELRGYTMTIAVLWWLTKRTPSEEMYASLLNNFVSSNYLFMSWNRTDMMKRLRAATERVKSGELLSEKPYQIVYQFLKERGLTA